MERYDIDKFLLPIWKGDTVYFETGMLVGEEGEFSLIYSPDKVLSVTDYGLQKTYVEGVDYVIDGKKIKRVKGSSMPYFGLDHIYSNEPARYVIEIEKSRCPDYIAGRDYLTYGEGTKYTAGQVAVTYTHSDGYKGELPLTKKDKFKEINRKLSSGESFDMVVYGDSISAGCNSSGTEFGGNVPPYADNYSTMVKKWLERRFNVKIGYRNMSVGGWDTLTGLNDFNNRIISENSDLMILAFGMNDLRTPLDKYREMIKEMVCRFREKNPKGEVVLVAPMLPNVESNWLLNQPLFLGELKALESKYDFVGVADLTTPHEYILSCGKRYRDMTANNINHPNDFIARLYSQIILNSLIGL